MASVLLAIVMFAAMASLLQARRRDDRPLEVISKTVASACFVVLGALRWSDGNEVASWLVAGLLLCLIGDILLLGDRSFDLGLVAFLAGHLAYVGAFVVALPIASWPLPPLLLSAAASIAVGWWLWPHLGRRRIPVAAYIVAITMMVWGAWSVFLAGALGWRVAAGATLFYLSDLAVARQRFVKPEFLNRALGLPAYYLGQLLIALSI